MIGTTWGKLRGKCQGATVYYGVFDWGHNSVLCMLVQIQNADPANIERSSSRIDDRSITRSLTTELSCMRF